MSFLETLWEILTMWVAWLSLAVVLIASFIVKYGTDYIATFSPVLSFVFGAIGMLLTVTTVIWIVNWDLWY